MFSQPQCYYHPSEGKPRISSQVSKARYPKPGVQSQESKQRNPKPGIQGQESQTRIPKPGIENQPGVQNQEPKPRNLKPGFPKQKFKTRNPSLGIQKQEYQTRNVTPRIPCHEPRPAISNHCCKATDWKSKFQAMQSEIRSSKPEVQNHARTKTKESKWLRDSSR